MNPELSLPMQQPVRILSDLHLGHGISRIGRVQALRPLIAGAGTVVFNGDTWQELAKCLRERSREMLDELQSLCREEGAATVFLPGNHDPGWEGDGWLGLAGGRIVVTHGDTLYPDGAPWSRDAIRKREQIRQLWHERATPGMEIGERFRLARDIARMLAPESYPKGRAFWRRAVDAAYPPTRAFRMLQVWATLGDTGAEFAERYFPRADVVVLGHFHRAGIWNRGRRLVINTGAFMNPCRSLMVEWSDGMLTCAEIDERGESCRPGRIRGVWRMA